MSVSHKPPLAVVFALTVIACRTSTMASPDVAADAEASAARQVKASVPRTVLDGDLDVGQLVGGSDGFAASTAHDHHQHQPEPTEPPKKGEGGAAPSDDPHHGHTP